MICSRTTHLILLPDCLMILNLLHFQAVVAMLLLHPLWTLLSSVNLIINKAILLVNLKPSLLNNLNNFLWLFPFSPHWFLKYLKWQNDVFSENCSVECKRHSWFLERVNEVDHFMFTEHVDILLISKTHFTVNNYLNIRGYTFYHSDHPSGNARGGAGILIKSILNPTELPKYSKNDI